MYLLFSESSYSSSSSSLSTKIQFVDLSKDAEFQTFYTSQDHLLLFSMLSYLWHWIHYISRQLADILNSLTCCCTEVRVDIGEVIFPGVVVSISMLEFRLLFFSLIICLFLLGPNSPYTCIIPQLQQWANYIFHP